MPEIIKITDVLKTGHFGPVRIGDSKETMIEKLGEPDGIINVIPPGEGIHYSMYEFFFHENRLCSFQNDHFSTKYPEEMEFKNNQIEIDPDLLRADRPKVLGEIATLLKRQGIPFQIIDYLRRKAISFASGVVIDFNDERWDQKANDWVKTKNLNVNKLIGFRFYPEIHPTHSAR